MYVKIALKPSFNNAENECFHELNLTVCGVMFFREMQTVCQRNQ